MSIKINGQVQYVTPDGRFSLPGILLLQDMERRLAELEKKAAARDGA